jgi:hypothetical protein
MDVHHSAGILIGIRIDISADRAALEAAADLTKRCGDLGGIGGLPDRRRRIAVASGDQQ